MILSHRLGAIFIKTIKVAGTSVELALSAVCGPHDVITPINPDEPELRAAVGGRPPQNYVVHQRKLRAPRHRLIRPSRGPQHELRNHIPARALRELVGEATWQSYLTFTVDRNPWDRVVSLYHFDRFQRKFDGQHPFTAWLAAQPDQRLSNFPRYADGDEVIVDRVLLYERLDAELAELAAALGVTLPPLPRAKGDIRPEATRDWWSLYRDEDVERIATVCRREIALLGYGFDGATGAS